MFPFGFFPPDYYPVDYWPELGSNFAGRGSKYGPNRVLGLSLLLADQQMQITKRIRETLLAKLAIQKINLLADLAFQRQIAEQTMYTVVFAEL